MYIIPEEFRLNEGHLILVPPGREKEVHQALIEAKYPVYHDFVNFAKRYNKHNYTVACFFDRETSIVHLTANVDPEWTDGAWHPDELIHNNKVHEILELLE